ncbi:GMP synthase-like glutamine amidotransferase [Caballeronia udeis]|jgi:GMP synthase-like glutamine amidotransferase|uniref:GMP synthase-like glutamine amidotransferase n=1 Tax=Caballeronia udeis TaxID=1232866 RepID=A0ABW8MW72_9BURK
MKVHVLQHASFEGLGNMEAWLRERDARISFSRLYESPVLPGIAEPGNIDLLIVLGGPMSVNDEAVLPWLAPEKCFIAAAIERGVAVLGVCLGAQLIAAAKGAKVYPANEKEIGWHPVSGTSRQASAFRFPDEVDVFHWHGETFDLPADAINLARSASCTNQAFQLGSRVIGLQFHLEVMRESVAGILDHCAGDLTIGRYVQSESHIRAAPEHRYTTVKTLMHSILDYLAA